MSVRMVPIQSQPLKVGGRYVQTGGGQIPEWLARVAFAEYERVFGRGQTFERLHERGGFGPVELLALLRGDLTDGAAKAEGDLRRAVEAAQGGNP